MKLLLLWLLPLLSYFPAVGPPAARVTFSPLTKAAYLAAKKMAVLTKPMMTFPVKKARGRIVIPTTVGNLVFTDRVTADDETQFITHKYLGFMPILKEHLLETIYWEGADYTLIESDGNKTKLISPPNYSPNQQYIITSSRGLVYGMMPNGIQLFIRKNGHPTLVWKLIPIHWEPAEAFWASDSIAYLKEERVSFNEYREAVPYKPARFAYVKLVVH